MSKPSDTPTEGVPTPAQLRGERSTGRSELGSRDGPSDGELGRAREAIRARMFPDLQAELDGRYRLVTLIGQGGWGQVYEAYDTKLRRKVAIKFLRGAAGDPESARALEREAQVLAQLQHPNIVAVHDVGRTREELYLTMELIDGVSLAAWLADDEHSWRASLSLMKQAAAGLAAAHEAGVVHRDFKPANVMVDRAGRVRVVDFGLAREVVWTAEDAVESAGEAGVLHTKAAGTPPYMAPEQLDGQVSAASDQFAFCTSLYEAVCGRRPWRGIDRGIGDRQDAAKIEQALRKCGLPGAVRQTIARGLQLRPEDRFADMRELLRTLEPRRSRWPLWAGGLVVAAGATLAGFVVQQDEPCVGRGTAAASLWNAAQVQALLGGMDDPRIASDVSAQMSGFVDRWNASDLETCEAEATGELSSGVAALRGRCLERVASRVGVALETASEGRYSDKDVARAVDSATSLRSCLDDDDALLRGMPEKGYDAEEGERIQRAIDAAFVYASFGDDARWLASLQALHASIASPGAALPDELWLVQHLGGALIRRGRLGEAGELLRPALIEANRHRGWVLQTSMLQVQLARLAAVQGRLDEAKLLISIAEPALSGLTGQQHAYVAALTHAQIANAAERGQEALDHLDRAEAIERGAGQRAGAWAGVEMLRADRELTRCSALVGLGQLENAASSCREVLRLLDAVGSEISVTRAAATNNLAVAMGGLGRSQDAAPLLRQTAAMKEQLGDPTGAATTWANLGNALAAAGDHAGALLAYAEAQRLLGDQRIGAVVSYRFNRGVSYGGAGAWSQSAADFEEALDIANELGVRSPVARYDIEVGLGVALAAIGEPARAQRVLERALRHETDQSDAYSKAELRITLAPLLDGEERRVRMWADAKKAATQSGDPELIAASAAPAP